MYLIIILILLEGKKLDTRFVKHCIFLLTGKINESLKRMYVTNKCLLYVLHRIYRC